jgi:hypothetical protein
VDELRALLLLGFASLRFPLCLVLLAAPPCFIFISLARTLVYLVPVRSHHDVSSHTTCGLVSSRLVLSQPFTEEMMMIIMLNIHLWLFLPDGLSGCSGAFFGRVRGVHSVASE